MRIQRSEMAAWHPAGIAAVAERRQMSGSSMAQPAVAAVAAEAPHQLGVASSSIVI